MYVFGVSVALLVLGLLSDSGMFFLPLLIPYFLANEILILMGVCQKFVCEYNVYAPAITLVLVLLFGALLGYVYSFVAPKSVLKD